jgi:hypothetical protein
MMRSARILVVVGVALFLAALTNVAFAQSTPVRSSTDLSVNNQVTVNQCSSGGEPVALYGNIHADMVFTNDSSGVNHFTIAVASSLTGNGQNSGQAYEAADSNSYSIDTTDGSGDITVEFRSDLTPIGGGSPQTLVQTLHLTTDLSGSVAVELLNSVTTCGS